MFLTGVLAAAVLASTVADLPPAAVPGDPREQSATQKEPPTPPHTGIRALFGNLGEDVTHLPEMQNAYLAAIGGGLALAVHPADQTFNVKLRSHYDTVNTIFAPGKYIGGTPEQIALSL